MYRTGFRFSRRSADVALRKPCRMSGRFRLNRSPGTRPRMYSVQHFKRHCQLMMTHSSSFPIVLRTTYYSSGWRWIATLHQAVTPSGLFCGGTIASQARECRAQIFPMGVDARSTSVPASSSPSRPWGVASISPRQLQQGVTSCIAVTRRECCAKLNHMA